MHITTNDAISLQFKTYRKTTLTQAYQLTQEHYDQYGGVIETLEGPASFVPGDWLCTGIKAEQWPVQASTFNENYEEARRDGNSVLYRSKGIREAVQINEDFTVRRSETEMYHGKPGDYLVRQGNKLWIVDAGVFEASYALVEEAS